MKPDSDDSIVDALGRDLTRLLDLQVALREAGFIDADLPAAA